MHPSGPDLGHETAVCREKLVQGQGLAVKGVDARSIGRAHECGPALTGRVCGPRRGVDVIDHKQDLRARPGIDMVQDLGDTRQREESGMRAPLLCEFAGKCRPRSFARFDLPAGQLEHAGAVPGVRGPALHEEAIGAEPDEAGDDDKTRWGFEGGVRGHARPGAGSCSSSWTLGKAAPILRVTPMRLFPAKITTIVEAVNKTLVDSGDLEVSDRDEFKRDVESILKEYLRKDREVTNRAKDELERRGLAYSDLFKIKRTMAEEQDFGIGDESVNWICSQLIELFMRSSFVSEIFAEDTVIRKKLKEILRRHMQADDDIDREVRRHLKHLSENTSTFEIEYQRQLELIKRKHGLE